MSDKELIAELQARLDKIQEYANKLCDSGHINIIPIGVELTRLTGNMKPFEKKEIT